MNKVIHHFCISFMKFYECGPVASFILRMTFYPPVLTALCVRFIRNSLFRVTWNGPGSAMKWQHATCNLQLLATVFCKDFLQPGLVSVHNRLRIWIRSRESGPKSKFQIWCLIAGLGGGSPSLPWHRILLLAIPCPLRFIDCILPVSKGGLPPYGPPPPFSFHMDLCQVRRTWNQSNPMQILCNWLHRNFRAKLPKTPPHTQEGVSNGGRFQITMRSNWFN